MSADAKGRDELRKHRRSLLAITSVVILYQLGWVSISGNVPIGGLEIAKDYIGWVLGAIFLYFFVLYHQKAWPLRISTELLRQANERINNNVYSAGERKAKRQARPEEKNIVFREPMRPPDWPIVPKQWILIFELRKEANAPDKRELSVEVKNYFYVHSIKAWVYCLLTDITIIEQVFPSVWAIAAMLLAIPPVGALVQGLFGSP